MCTYCSDLGEASQLLGSIHIGVNLEWTSQVCTHGSFFPANHLKTRGGNWFLEANKMVEKNGGIDHSSGCLSSPFWDDYVECFGGLPQSEAGEQYSNVRSPRRGA